MSVIPDAPAKHAQDLASPHPPVIFNNPLPTIASARQRTHGNRFTHLELREVLVALDSGADLVGRRDHVWRGACAGGRACGLHGCMAHLFRNERRADESKTGSGQQGKNHSRVHECHRYEDSVSESAGLLKFVVRRPWLGVTCVRNRVGWSIRRAMPLSALACFAHPQATSLPQNHHHLP